MLEKERKYFESNRVEWLKEYFGKYVLVKEENLLGTFNNQKDALIEGARRFGKESFLVRKVEGSDELIYIPALTLGILHADTTHST
jgi:hypothetical protein